MLSDLVETSAHLRKLFLQDAQERDQICLLLLRQVKLLDQIEKLDSIFERQQSTVVEVGGRLLNASQGKGLDRTLRGHHHAAFHPWRKKPFDFQVVHLIVRVERRRMT